MFNASKVESVLYRMGSSEYMRTLSDIEATRRWAWDARQDAAHERQLTAARYYIRGATCEDIEDEDTLREILRRAYDHA
jgi:hypothetical protein